MPRARNIEEAMEKYKGGETGEFFQLKDHKDSDVVRFLIADKLIQDEDWFVVHEYEIEGKKRYVQCTEETDCTGCGSGNSPQVKLFLQLIAKSDGKRKMWERGKKFYPKIDGLIKKYGDLCNRPYEIERNGKKGDTQTTYEVYPLDKDDKELRDLPFEKQNLLGKYGEAFILQLTRNEFEDLVDGRYRPESNSGSSRGNDRDRNSRDSGRGNDRDRDRSSSRDNDRDRDRNSDRGNDRDRDDRSRDRDSQDRESSSSRDNDRDRDREDPRDNKDSSSDRETRGSSDNSRKRSGSDVF